MIMKIICISDSTTGRHEALTRSILYSPTNLHVKILSDGSDILRILLIITKDIWYRRYKKEFKRHVASYWRNDRSVANAESKHLINNCEILRLRFVALHFAQDNAKCLTSLLDKYPLSKIASSLAMTYLIVNFSLYTRNFILSTYIHAMSTLSLFRNQSHRLQRYR